MSQSSDRIAPSLAGRKHDLGGLDYLRVAALALVFWQHACSVNGLDERTNVGPINLGQAGVEIFLALSGLLAARSAAPSGTWLTSRLRRIYPPYVIAVGVSLILAAAAQYKAVSLSLAAAQLAGVGWFTHGDAIVNVPTWFVSLLLACYVLAAPLRLLSHAGAAAAVAAIALWGAAAMAPSRLALLHVGTFFWGFAMGRDPSVARRMAWGAAATLVAALCLGRGVWSPLAGALGVVAVAAAAVPASVWRPVRRASGASYFIYLVHGPILLALATAWPGRFATTTLIGVVLAAVAGAGLRWASERAELASTNLLRLLARSPAPAKS